MALAPVTRRLVQSGLNALHARLDLGLRCNMPDGMDDFAGGAIHGHAGEVVVTGLHALASLEH